MRQRWWLMGLVVVMGVAGWYAFKNGGEVMPVMVDTEYVSERLGYRVVVPAGWTIEADERARTTDVLRDPYDGAEVFINRRAEGRVADALGQAMVLDEIEAAYRATGGASLHFFDREDVNGYPGYVTGGILFDTDPEWRFLEVGLFDGDQVWTVRANFELTAGEGYRGIVEAIMASFALRIS